MTVFRGLEPWRAIPLLAILSEILWIYPWFVWVGEWKMLGWIEPPLTLGSAVVLSVIAEVLSHRSLTKSWTLSSIYLGVLPVLALLLVVVVRLDMSGEYALWDLGWMQYALEHQSLIYGGLILGAILLWRGISAGRNNPSFDDLYRKFLVGLIALVLLLVLRSFITEASEVVASNGFYILGFFSIGLLSLGLINLGSIREEMLHREGSSGVLDQRWFPMLLVVVMGILAGSLLIASAFSFNLATSLLRPLGVLIGWVLTTLIYIVAFPVGVVAAGLIYILRFLASLVGRGEMPEPFDSPNPEEIRRALEGQEGLGIPPEALLALKLVLVILVVLLILFILGRALRQYWRGKEEEESIEEISESLWSWEGFKSDLWSFLSRLLSRFKRQKHAMPELAHFPVGLGGGEATGGMFTVREIYQELLREGHRAGLPRRQPETPFEYQERLQASFPPGRPEIEAITEAYIAQRYGLVEASAEHLGLLNHRWRRLLDLLQRVTTEADHR